MTTDAKKLQIPVVVDGTDAKQGFQEVKAAGKDMAQSLAQSGQTASKALDGIGDGAKKAADSFNREEGRLRASIQRATLDLQTFGKAASEKLEAKIQFQGLDSSKFAPYIAQLKALEAQQKTLGVSAGQTANAFRTLPAQFTDIATQLAGGQSPFLILLQQGGQIKDSFGGIGNAAKALASLITPTTIAIGGMVAAFGGLAIAVTHAEKLQQSLNTLEAQLTATGRAGLISSGDLKKFIEQLAQAPGVTRDSATAIVSEFTKIHNIGAALFKDLAASTADYARATGTDLPTAAKTLAQAFNDPIKGAKTLDDALGTLSSTQLLQIENLTKQNDLVGAQRVLYDALQQSVKGLATDALTPLQKATNDLGNSWEKTMGELSKSDGIKTVNNLLVETVGLVTYLVNNAGKLGGIGNIATGLLPGGVGLGAVAGGAGAFLRNQLGIKPLFGGDGAPKSTGGATGSWDDAAGGTNGNGSAGGSLVDDEIKRALVAAKTYKGQAAQIADLTQERKTFNSALEKSISLYGKESDQAQKFRDAIAGVDEKIESIKKKGATAPKAYQDDAATKMLETLRQTEASLKEQLSSNDKLTASEKERAKFAQLIDDLKGKKQLTEEQKSLLSGQEAIKAQLDKNVAIEQEIVSRQKAVKLAEQQLSFEKQMQGIALSYESANASRSEQYDRTLSTIGMGSRARQEVEAQKSIRKEYDRYVLQANKQAADASKDGFDAFGTDAYKKQIEAIGQARESELDKQKQFFAAEQEARENWVNGAKEAFANYADEASNAAKHTEEAFGNAFRGIEDQAVNLLTGKKVDLKGLFDATATDFARNVVKENFTGPLAAMAGKSFDDGGLLSSIFGSGTKSGATSARGASASNPLYVRSVDSFGGAANAATFGGSSSSSGSGIAGALGSIFGGFSNGTATTVANALPGDALDNLIKLQGGWASVAGFAGGGDPPVGRVSMVGERGPELFVPKQAGTIVPNDALGGGTTVTNVFHLSEPASRKTQEQVALAAGRGLSRAQRNA